ncbi:MAG TPA: M20 family metallopeptidase [Candidatus Binataceae bacterium]|jgi:acetylornithine deacetylase/succinyl-diaminopimelate desuccinylase-like protein
MDNDALQSFVNRRWDESIVPALTDYIRIPNKSPAFDRDWQAHGLIDEVVERFHQWALRHPLRGMKAEVVQLQGRTPLLLIDVPGQGDDCVLMYGHLDKQPEMTGWSDGLDPWQPVIRGDRLYGRGAADDGYAMFAGLSAIAALQDQGIPHARCVMLIEACEESGSPDLPHIIEHLGDRIGNPSLVIALDSGCGNYDQLWCTTSLRGLAGGSLRIAILTEGVHSGDAGGVVPCTFRIARMLLSRIENEQSGEIRSPAFHSPIPPARQKQAAAAAAVLGDSIHAKFPFTVGAGPINTELAELILNRTWRPALSIIGADGLPPAANAGNVLRPATELKLSLRLPPTCDARAAAAELKSVLEKNPPYGAQVSFEPNWASSGWDAPQLAPWLEKSLEEASRACFGKPAAYMGEGGTIPFMGMLGERFPQAQFLITGVLGPNSNAHGPNEFLHIPTGKRLTCCVARVIADHFRRPAP